MPFSTRYSNESMVVPWKPPLSTVGSQAELFKHDASVPLCSAENTAFEITFEEANSHLSALPVLSTANSSAPSCCSSGGSRPKHTSLPAVQLPYASASTSVAPDGHAVPGLYHQNGVHPPPSSASGLSPVQEASISKRTGGAAGSGDGGGGDGGGGGGGSGGGGVGGT